jgi:tryptophan halogenase
MKIAILGKGTAGSLAFNHFRHHTDLEIDCIFDSNIKEQSVGEGSTLILPKLLDETLDLKYKDLHLIDGHYKKGIDYINWGNKNFFHHFPLQTISLHFNAVKLQNLLYEKNINKVNFIDKNIKNYNDVDADFIIDCRGKPKDYKDYNKGKYIPVNAAYVVHCDWDEPLYDYTLCIARPYGWVFGIPLANRISFGYLYNENINTLKEIEKDLEIVINSYNQIPNGKVNNLKFNNYYKKINYDNKLFFNGNASFFLEPMEATSISTIDLINRNIYDVIYKNINYDQANKKYINWFKQTQEIITMHYYANEKYDTPFWKYAKDLATQCMLNFKEKKDIINNYENNINFGEYGGWYYKSFKENIEGLGIKNKLLMI